MRKPLLSKSSQRTRIAKKITIPAPYGGWNSRDAPSNMPKTDAYEMVNMIPNTDSVICRSGSSNYATGMTGIGKTLAVFSSLGGVQTMFCATDSGIYNVNVSGAVGASVLARTNGKHQIVNMGDGTNNWLMMFNGVDKPAYYNGTTWTAVDGASVPALTGVTTTGLVTGMEFKGRLILGEINTLKFWYLASGAVGGALTAFDLTAYASRGGYLMAMGTWTYDGGAGQDDRAVFITSEGEVIVYEGTDPGVAANWARVGTYYFGKPLGRRCLAKYGGDLIVLTENGIIQLAKALIGVVNESQFKLSDKIRTDYNRSSSLYSSVFGWEAIIYPKNNVLIVNVPHVEDGDHYQYMMNLTTGSWCLLTGINAETFGILNSQLYYTRSTKTVKAFDQTSTTDEGVAIQYYCTPAFVNFGSAEKKKINGISLALVTTGGTPLQISLAPYVDYWTVGSGGTSSFYYVPAPRPSRLTSCPAFPIATSFSFSTPLSGTNQTSWYATDWLYEDASGL